MGLLDAGCGPGLLAIGFAPYVGSCVGVDPEPGMIRAARAAANEAGVLVRLIEGRLEDLPEDLGTFHLNLEACNRNPRIGAGRGARWFDRYRTLPSKSTTSIGLSQSKADAWAL
jgi:predicted RNA methylase